MFQSSKILALELKVNFPLPNKETEKLWQYAPGQGQQTIAEKNFEKHYFIKYEDKSSRYRKFPCIFRAFERLEQAYTKFNNRFSQ